MSRTATTEAGRQVVGLALLLSAACVDVSSRAFEPSSALVFLLRISASNGALIAAEGPLGPDPILEIVTEGETLVRLEIDESKLNSKFTFYRDTLRPKLEVVSARPELDGCEATGFLREDESLEVPLTEEALGEGTLSASEWEGPREVPVSLPGGLALRLNTSNCAPQAQFDFRPFAGELAPTLRQQLGRQTEIRSISMLGTDHLLLASLERLALLGRDGAAEPVLSTVDLGAYFDLRPGERNWSISHANVVPGEWPRGPAMVLVALSAREADGALARYETRGAYLRLALSSTGAFSLIEHVEVIPEAQEERGGFRHVFVEPSGGYIIAGREMIVTATTADSPPRLRTGIERIAARFITALNEPGAPHLMFIDGSQVVEGNLFVDDWQSRVYFISNSSELRLHQAARAHGSTGDFIATGNDQALWQRVRPGAWTTRPYSLPGRAAACATAPVECGRRAAITSLGPMAPVPSGEGFLFASSQCSAVFWIQPGALCAATAAPGGVEIEAGTAYSVTAMATFGSETFVGTADGQILRLEVRQE